MNKGKWKASGKHTLEKRGKKRGNRDSRDGQDNGLFANPPSPRAGSKLSPEQWKELTDLKRSEYQAGRNFSLQNAVDYIKSKWHIDYSRSSLQQNRHWVNAVEELDMAEAENQRRHLKDNATFVVAESIANIKDLTEERKQLRKDLRKLQVGSTDRRAIEARLKDVEDEFRKFVTQYTQLHKDFSLPTYQNDKLKDRESAEVQEAIKGILANLEKRVFAKEVPLTPADNWFQAKYGDDGHVDDYDPTASDEEFEALLAESGVEL